MRQPTPLSAAQLDELRSLAQNGQVTQVYDFLASQGYNYADWANGVNQSNTLAGASALTFMHNSAMAGTGMADCRIISPQAEAKIKVDMAVAYINALKSQTEGGVPTYRDINAGEVWEFHGDVFRTNQLAADTWTLHTVFDIIGPPPQYLCDILTKNLQ